MTRSRSTPPSLGTLLLLSVLLAHCSRLRPEGPAPTVRPTIAPPADRCPRVVRDDGIASLSLLSRAEYRVGTSFRFWPGGRYEISVTIPATPEMRTQTRDGCVFADRVTTLIDAARVESSRPAGTAPPRAPPGAPSEWDPTTILVLERSPATQGETRRSLDTPALRALYNDARALVRGDLDGSSADGGRSPGPSQRCAGHPNAWCSWRFFTWIDGSEEVDGNRPTFELRADGSWSCADASYRRLRRGQMTEREAAAALEWLRRGPSTNRLRESYGRVYSLPGTRPHAISYVQTASGERIEFEDIETLDALERWLQLSQPWADECVFLRS